MDFMDQVLDVDTGSLLVSRVASDDFGDEVAREWLVSALEQTNGDAGQVDWASNPRHSRVIASAIEEQIKNGSITRDNTTNLLSALVYVPIMIRVFAGGEALKGERFDWPVDQAGNHYTKASDGCDWDISGSEGSWEITIAMWDRAEYKSSSLERAKLICEQIHAAS